MKDGKYVILCIDDDRDMRDSIRLILESKGYAVEDAASAEEGLAVFKDTSPDLVVVDLMMEEVDAGTNFVRELKAQGSDVPVYMLSSVGDSLSMSADYSSLGLAGVLQKPVNPETLLKALESKLK